MRCLQYARGRIRRFLVGILVDLRLSPYLLASGSRRSHCHSRGLARGLRWSFQRSRCSPSLGIGVRSPRAASNRWAYYSRDLVVTVPVMPMNRVLGFSSRYVNSRLVRTLLHDLSLCASSAMISSGFSRSRYSVKLLTDSWP